MQKGYIHIEQSNPDLIKAGSGVLAGNMNSWHGRLKRVRLHISPAAGANLNAVEISAS